MNRPIRGILFITFITLFFITAPIVVLYTAGYRYDFTKGEVVQTGSFFVTTTPNDATIYINNTPQEETTPAVIQKIYPDNYEIRIEKNGYHNWQKTLPINSQLTTFIDGAYLFLETDPIRIFEQNFESPSFLDSNKFLFTKTETLWIEIWIYDLVHKQQNQVARVSTRQADKVESSISKDETALLLKQTKNQIETFKIVEMTNLNNSINLNNYVFEEIEDAYWHPDHGNDLFVIGNSSTYLFSIGTRQAEKIYSQPTNAYSRFERIYITEQKDDATEIVAITPEESIVTTIPKSDYTFLQSTEPYLLLRDTIHSKLVLVDIYDEFPILLNTDGQDFDWITNHKGESVLLYHNGFEIHTYNTSTNIDELITRVSEPILDTFWHSSGSYIIMTTVNKIQIIELDTRDHRQTIDLVSNTEISSSYISQDSGTIYLTGPSGDSQGLFELPLID